MRVCSKERRYEFRLLFDCLLLATSPGKSELGTGTTGDSGLIISHQNRVFKVASIMVSCSYFKTLNSSENLGVV